MKKILSFPLVLLLIVLILKFLGIAKPLAAPEKGSSEAAVPLQVEERPTVYRPSRIGINLGRWDSRGTQQLSSNILMNPGFEGTIDRVIVIISQTSGKSFSGEAGWGYPNNAWNEAEYTIQTGESAGQRGVVLRSLESGENGLPQYFSKEPLPPLQKNDIVVLTKLSRTSPGSYWQVNDRELVTYDPFENRDGSGGSQSIRLSPTRTSQAEMRYYADTIADRSGNMLPVRGKWLLSFWAKAQSPQSELEITFVRVNNDKPFLQEVIYPTTEWQEYNLEFKGESRDDPGFLKLTVKAVKPDNVIWIDDMTLGPSGEEEAFRKEIAAALKILNPSYLREFPPLSDTWENRIAPPDQRKSFMYRTAGGAAYEIYSYSTLSFLNLCTETDANPWLILPPVFSEYECRQFGKFLAEHATRDKFSDVILEFGSENWNWLNRPVGIPYPEEHGEAADRSFRIIQKETESKVNIRFVVNGPFSNLNDSLQFIQHAELADGLSATPYFFRSLGKATPDKDILEKLFDQESEMIGSFSDALFSQGKSFLVSEINLHTTEGDAGTYERNRVVAGAAAGSALAKKIIDSLYAGADPILVYKLGQFDTPAWEVDDFVNLWGVVREFSNPPLFRPTGLAVTMLNQVIGGNMHAVVPVEEVVGSEALTAAAFKTSTGWKAAVISKHDAEIELEIAFPDDQLSLPNAILTLEADSPFETNEYGERVTIVKKQAESTGRVVRVAVPPRGFIVLTH